MTKRVLTFTTIAFFTLHGAKAAAQHSAMPPGITHEEHLAQLKMEAALKARGAAAMGFDQDLTTHHFLLFDDGGAIEVTVSRDDAATLAAVRGHLQTIAHEFASGVFDKPFATHAEVPAGAPALQQLRSSLQYTYTDIANGGLVRISTSDRNALAAVHAFLRYQIVEHKTGDSLTPRKQ
jgi:hypothetical protein